MRLEAIASRLEAIVLRLVLLGRWPSLLGWRLEDLLHKAAASNRTEPKATASRMSRRKLS